MLANWLFGFDDFVSIFGFPLVCLVVIGIGLAHIKQNDPERWQRMKDGQDEATERYKKFAGTTLNVASKVIGNVLKKK